jgi:uncharacterized protein YidB (DUF937 family)
MAMSNDSLFAGAFSGPGKTVFLASSEDIRIAGALTDMFVEGAHGFESVGFDALQKRFNDAGLQPQFDSWVKHHEIAYVTPEQVEKALGGPAIDYIQQRTGIRKFEVVERLKSVLPKVIGEAAPFGGKPSDRTFCYHLRALRRRLTTTLA